MKYLLLGSLLFVGCANLVNISDEALYFRRMTSKSVLKLYNINHHTTASGFTTMVKERKIVVTNAHVCGAPPFELYAKSDATNEIYPVQPIAVNPGRDICLAELIGAEAIPPLSLAESNAEVGQSVFTLGYPLGRYLRLMEGQVEFYSTSGMSWFATNIWIVPGQSGSPVLNKDREVVGVVYGTDRQPTHTGYVVPVDSLKIVIKDLEQEFEKSDNAANN